MINVIVIGLVLIIIFMLVEITLYNLKQLRDEKRNTKLSANKISRKMPKGNPKVYTDKPQYKGKPRYFNK